MSASAAPDPPSAGRGPVSELGARLRGVRQAAGISAREVARQLGVSPSFISQIETGKSLPSVATLYDLSQLFNISIDELFELSEEAGEFAARAEDAELTTGSRSAEATEDAHLAHHADATGVTVAGPAPAASPAGPVGGHGHEGMEGPQVRVSVVRSDERSTLRMASGVVWERLAATRDRDINFMEVVYPVGSASTADNSMLRHEGYEYQYVLRGELKVVVEFDEYLLRAGDSMGFDSSLPHYLENPGDVDTHCIVAVHRCAGGLS